jgi:hypothetical protein
LTPIVIVIALGGVKAGIGATTYTSVSPMNYRHGSTLEALYTQNAPLCTDMNLVYMCALSVSCANFKNYAAGAWLSTRCTERKIAVVSDVAGNDGATAAAMGSSTHRLRYTCTRPSHLDWRAKSSERSEALPSGL